jgi:hypothetical protein
MSTPTLNQTFPETPLKPLKTIEEMAAEQGIKPFDFTEAWQAAAGIWPEDESAEDFTAWLSVARNEGMAESRPE